MGLLTRALRISELAQFELFGPQPPGPSHPKVVARVGEAAFSSGASSGTSRRPAPVHVGR